MATVRESKRAADLLRETAQMLKRGAADLEARADQLLVSSDPDDMSEGINILRNLVSNLRLDLFVSRAISLAQRLTLDELGREP